MSIQTEVQTHETYMNAGSDGLIKAFYSISKECSRPSIARDFLAKNREIKGFIFVLGFALLILPFLKSCALFHVHHIN